MMFGRSIEKNQALILAESYFRMIVASILKIGVDTRFPCGPIGVTVRSRKSQWLAVSV